MLVKGATGDKALLKPLEWSSAKIWVNNFAITLLQEISSDNVICGMLALILIRLVCRLNLLMIVTLHQLNGTWFTIDIQLNTYHSNANGFTCLFSNHIPWYWFCLNKLIVFPKTLTRKKFNICFQQKNSLWTEMLNMFLFALFSALWTEVLNMSLFALFSALSLERAALTYQGKK